MEMPGEINKRQPVMKKVRACKSLYGSVVEDLTEVISRFRPDGTFIFVNEVYCRFFGKEREELLGCKWHPVADTEDLPLIEEKLRTMSASNPVVIIENRVYSGCGEVRWMQFVNRGFFDPEGKLLEVQSVGRDITERKRDEAVLAARMHLMEFSEKLSLDELLEETLNEAERLTGSRIGFYHFVKDDQKTLSLQNWSTQTKAIFCKAGAKGRHYDIADAGVWVESFHQRKPVIHNDYASLSNRKGMPEGHAEVIRELVVPSIRGDKIVALLGIGNKPVKYNDQDVQTVSRLADLAWDIVERKRMMMKIEVERNRLASLLESIPDEVWFADTNHVFTLANPSAVREFAIDRTERIEVETLARDLEILRPDGSPRSIEEAPPLRALAGEIVRNMEEIVRTPASGELRHRQVNAAPVRNADGDIIGSVSVVRDITERKKAEEALWRAHDELEQRVQERTAALYESEQKFRTFASAVPAWLWLNDAEGRNQFLYEYFILAVGKSAEEIRETGWQTLVHPADAPEYIESYLDAVRNLRAWDRRVRVRYRDGQWHWLHSYSRPWFGQDGRLLGHFGAGVDITATIEAEEALRRLNAELEDRVAERTAALRKSREKLDLTMRTARMGSWSYELNAGRFEADESGMALHGFGPGETITRMEESSRHIHPDDVPEIQRRFEHAVRTRGTYENEYRVVLPDGSIRWIYSLGRVPEGSSYLIGMVQDITERKKVEEQLKEKQKFVESVTRMAPDVIYLYDIRQQRHLYINKDLAYLLGYSTEEIKTHGVDLLLEAIHPEDLPAVMQHIDTLAHTASNASYSLEYRIKGKDGNYLWFYVREQVYQRDHTQQPEILFGICQDITERRMAEEALRKSETLLIETQSISNVGGWEYDVEHGRNVWTEEVYRIYGVLPGQYDPNDLAAVAAYFVGDDKTRIESAFRRAVEEGEPYDLELRFRNAHGEEIWVRAVGKPVRKDGKTIRVSGNFMDITERKAAEEQLRQSHGEMQMLAKRFSDSDEEIRRKIAAELHDRIGQNLTALSINLHYMKSQFSDESLKQIEGRMLDSMNLLEGTIEQLRDITTELRPALQWHGNQFSNRTGINVLIEGSDLIPSLPAVVETAIFRIVQEALTNVSKHAMAQRVEVMFRKMEGKIEIVIKDNGIGFDAEEVRKKQSLGLVTMKERARAINGSISFITSPGKGTSVALEVPG